MATFTITKDVNFILGGFEFNIGQGTVSAPDDLVDELIRLLGPSLTTSSIVYDRSHGNTLNGVTVAGVPSGSGVVLTALSSSSAAWAAPAAPTMATPAIILGSAAAAGVATTPIRSDSTIAAFDATVPVTQAFADAAATGSAAFAARRDHKHGMPSERVASSTTPAAVGTAAVGTGTTDARSDHVHATGAGTPVTQAFSDAAAIGTGPAAAMTDHKHGMPANPVRAQSSTTPAAVGTAAVGVGTTDARSDHVHATGAGTPSTQALGDAAAVGTGPAAAMTDHKHAMPNSTAGPDADITIDVAGAAGTAATAARSAHGHKLATASTAGAAHGVAAAGTSGTAPSRGDHVHPAQISKTDVVAASGDYVARAKIAADTTYRIEMGFDTADQGSVEFGAGGVAARDWSIHRNTALTGPFVAGVLMFDRLGTAANTQIGISATTGQTNGIFMGVISDTTSRVGIRGDASESGIQIGPGNAARDLRAYRSAAKILTIDDTAAGNVTLNVVGTIQQGGTGVSISGHGAADHADITRKVFLEAALAKLDSATAANVGASPDLMGVVAYADAATQGAIWSLMVPADWASGVITLQPVWSPGSTDASAHTVRWSITAKAVAAGSTVTAAGTTTAFTGSSAARTVGVVVYDTATSSGITPAAAGDLFRFTLQRIGADAADTYVGIVNLLGVIASYTANQ